MAQTNQICIYDPAVSIVFRKTKERFGGLSNMAAGFPLKVNGMRIRTSEALYQACRFPHRPDVQRRIIDARSPMTAKMRSKPFRKESRPDWNGVRVQIMRWCLRVKLAENWHNFGTLLLATGDCPIVERSRRDDFWGTKVAEDGTLVGMNVLGRLLMELRGQLKANASESLRVVEPVPIPEFLLLRKTINTIYAGEGIGSYVEAEPRPTPAIEALTSPEPLQQLLFNRPVVTQVQTESQNVPTAENVRRNMPEPYPSYRDSGMPWLDLMPEHWKKCKIKHLARPGYKTFVDGDWIESPYITADGIRLIQTGNIGTGEYIEKGFRYINEETFDDFRCTEIKPGDVLICRLGEPVARACLAPQLDRRMITSVDVCILKTRKDVDGKFLVYCMSAYPYLVWVGSLVRGSTRDRVSRSMLGNFSLPFPPLREQAGIVRYLDHVDWRIQRYIRAKQKLIALLEEQKQAVIHQAVTGQIDVRTGRPYPAYKHSGVEWLGKVPEHWEVRRSKRTFTPRQELANPNDIQLSATQAYGVIAQEDYERRVGRKVVKILRHLEQRRHVEVDDFVISMRSFQGGLERAWQSGCIRSSYIVLQAAAELVVGYFGHLFKSVGYIAALQSTANFIRDGQDLNFENFCRVDVPFPRKEEQQLISATLDRVTMDIGSTIERARREIDLLCEYRTRLIADVVTGKLDVREAAERLPGEVEEPEPLGETDAQINGEEELTDNHGATTEEAGA